MIGLSSLDLLAYPVRYSGRLIAAVVDARRGVERRGGAARGGEQRRQRAAQHEASAVKRHRAR
jgi:hypothetical protein